MNSLVLVFCCLLHLSIVLSLVSIPPLHVFYCLLLHWCCPLSLSLNVYSVFLSSPMRCQNYVSNDPTVLLWGQYYRIGATFKVYLVLPLYLPSCIFVVFPSKSYHLSTVLYHCWFHGGITIWSGKGGVTCVNPLTMKNKNIADFRESSTACSSWYAEFRTFRIFEISLSVQKLWKIFSFPVF